MDAPANLILVSNTKLTTTFLVISTAYKIVKKLVPRNGFYPAYLTRSFRHRTGEASLAVWETMGLSVLVVKIAFAKFTMRAKEVPGL